ncbi:MAG: type II secretion system protein N [Rhodoferax sp.]|nr:type II secretion system protein N [Rhodoferax sp.]MCF8208347.1 type II secretion system protein N [Rhodoferax sp.]
MAIQHRNSSAHYCPWGWAAAGLLIGVLAGVLLFAPARWLAAALRNASNLQVELVQARGTVWQGSAQLVLSGGAGSRDAVVLPGSVQWRLQPRWGALSLEFRAECCTPQAMQLHVEPLGLGGVRMVLADSPSRWPASLLAGLGTPWNTVRALGQLDLSSQQLTLEWVRGRVHIGGSLQLDANDISSRLSTLQPMGSYRFTLTGGQTTQLRLETLSGSLQLSGSGVWLGQSLRFEGIATAEPQRIEALSNLLNIIGRREGARSIIKVG